MTHPALYSVEDSINAIEATLTGGGLSVMQRQVLVDMRDDLYRAEDISTFSDVIDLAIKSAKRGYY